MQKLREQGHRVVVLSNTNRLHTTFWPDEYPEIRAAADHIYLSQEMGMRKPEARIYQSVLELKVSPLTMRSSSMITRIISPGLTSWA
jgi:FMN phosphatase YigB (HAD superfamily)